MPTATETFFASLSGTSHEPLMRRVKGSARFDIGSGRSVQHWLVTIDRGDITVSRGARGGDCVIQTDTDAFERILSGADNAMAAYLRGAINAEGDLELVMLCQRLFAGPASRVAGHG